MRFAHVRVAAVTLLSGSILTLGPLDNAQAAPLATPGNTDTVCRALPASGTPTPSPSPSKSPSPSPSPSPAHSTNSSSPAAAHSAAVNDPSSGSSPSTPTGTGTASASTAATSTTTATLAADVSTSPSSDPSPTASGTGTAGPPELCVSVQRSQTSIKRGQTAGYVVQVSTKNGSASDVTIALTAQPTSQKPTFSGGCAKDDGTATCHLSSVTTKAISLNAQIPVGSKATSVSSVKLIATASVATTTKWTPPAAAETTAVTAAAAKGTASPKGSASPVAAQHLAVLPLGPIPALNGEASMVGPGNAANLFPTIGPSRGASASPGPDVAAAQPSGRDTGPISEASPVSAGTPVFTAQVAGLIALGLAIMLTATRLMVRRRSKPRG